MIITVVGLRCVAIRGNDIITMARNMDFTTETQHRMLADYLRPGGCYVGEIITNRVMVWRPATEPQKSLLLIDYNLKTALVAD
jgi:hypothetical protein